MLLLSLSKKKNSFLKVLLSMYCTLTPFSKTGTTKFSKIRVRFEWASPHPSLRLVCKS